MILSGMICVMMGAYLNSFLMWCGLFVGAGILFELSVSLVNTQMESMICVSEMFLDSPFSGVMVLLTIWIYVMSLLVSDKISKDELGGGFFLLLSSLAMICYVFFKVNDFFLLYIFFEGVLIPIVFMILGWGRQPERFEAGVYMLIYTIIGSLPLLLCLLWFWGMNLSSFFFLGLNNGGFFKGSFVMLMVSLAFLIKMPLFSMHGWLPKAHVEAPVAGSMMLAGILLKMGVYGMSLFYEFMKVEFIWMFEGFMVIGVMGGVMSGFVCLYQSDMKALIAYSSVSHMCFLLVGLMSMGWVGWEGVILMAISHGICSPWLFFLSNYLSEMSGTRSLCLLKGVLLVCPSFSFLMFLGISGNMAVPPCMSLLAELSLFISGTFFSLFLVFPMMVLCFLATSYSLSLYSSVNHGKVISKTKMKGSLSFRCLLGSSLSGAPLIFLVLVIDVIGLGG